jgi:hypothetical protein
VRYAAVLAALTAFGGGAAFAGAEKQVSTWDGFWWSVTTMTTVGYGDIYPHTTAGRLVAIFMMPVGIGFIALLTGAFAQRFLARERNSRSSRRGCSRLRTTRVRSTRKPRAGGPRRRPTVPKSAPARPSPRAALREARRHAREAAKEERELARKADMAERAAAGAEDQAAKLRGTAVSARAEARAAAERAADAEANLRRLDPRAI